MLAQILTSIGFAVSLSFLTLIFPKASNSSLE